VMISPVVTYSIQKCFNYWPVDPFYDGFFQEVTCFTLGIIAINFVPFPFLTAPISLSFYIFMEYNLAHLFFAIPSLEQLCWISIIFGAFMLVFFYLIDLQKFSQDWCFWGYFFGVSAFWGGFTTLYYLYNYPIYTSPGFGLVYFAVNLFLMGMAVVLQRIIFFVLGGLGSSYYIANFLFLYSTTTLNSFISILFGIVLIVIALYVTQKYPTSGFPFWGYLFGVALLWTGMLTLYTFVYTNLYYKSFFCAVNIILMIMTIYTKQVVFLFVGTIGVLVFVFDLVSNLFWNSVWLPLILTALGLIFISLAIYFATHTTKVRKQSCCLTVVTDK